jgi:hypothetical protein
MTKRSMGVLFAFVVLASTGCGQWPGVHEAAMQQAVE